MYSLVKMQPPVPDLDMVLRISFDHLARSSLKVRRACANHLASLYCPNSAGGRWANTSQRCLFIFVNELFGDLNNHLCLLMILEKLRVVPYYAFYGSLYTNAMVLPPEQRGYASQAYYNIICRYIPRNRIHCVGTFHPGFDGETEFERIVKIDPNDP